MSRTSPRSLVFDLDDTLVATRHLSDRAYMDVAGVTPPPDAHGLHWQDWLPHAIAAANGAPGGVVVDGYARNVHDRKEGRVLELLKQESPLPLAAGEVALNPPPGTLVSVITKASYRYARTALEAAGLGKLVIIGWHIQPESRPTLLAIMNHRGAYVDDRAETVDLVNRAPGDWRAIHVTPETTSAELRGTLSQ